MKETPQQYTQRILGYVEGKEPLAVQAGTAMKLERLIEVDFSAEPGDVNVDDIVQGRSARGLFPDVAG